MDTLNTNEQLKLVMKTIPLINWEKFSLKGGSAINLFYRPLSRISVDIDLTYRVIANREETIRDISKELHDLFNKINSGSFAKSELKYFREDRTTPNKVLVEGTNAEILIEPNFTIRGSVFPDTLLKINPQVAERLGVDKNLKAMVMSFEDVYAGKICAALSRQHPRDLFDIKQLLDNEGISTKTKDATLIYLCSNNRTVSELIEPSLLDVKAFFNQQFFKSTAYEFNYEQYLETRQQFVHALKKEISEKDVEFILSFSNGNPTWSLLEHRVDIERVKSLPSVQWKLQNILKMDNGKRIEELHRIEEAFISRSLCRF